jgi:hypothetical protein
MLFREDDKRELALALDAGEGKRKKKSRKKSQGRRTDEHTLELVFTRKKMRKKRERQKADANIWRITGLTIPMSYHLWEL